MWSRHESLRDGARVRRTDGQASLEYTALLALVAIVVAVGGGLGMAPSIVNAVGRQMRTALCRVGAGRCEALERQACTVRSRSTDGAVTAKLAFLRVGRGYGLLRSERSDGTVELTLLEHLDVGAEAGLGAEGHLEVGGVHLGGGGLLQAEAVARLGGGRSWSVPDGRAADRLQRRLVEVLAGRVGSSLPVVGPVAGILQHVTGRGAGRSLPEPDERTTTARATLELGAQGAGTSLSGEASLTLAVQRRRDGSSTRLLSVDGTLAGELMDGVAGRQGRRAVSIAVVHDPGGRPVELTVTTTRSLSASAGLGKLPPELQGQGTRGEEAEVAATLDLTSPAERAAADTVLAALARRDPRAAAAAVGGLGRLLEDARVEIRRTRTDEAALGGGGEVAAGAKVGVDVRVTRGASRLRDAWSRPEGGVWERRVDCRV